MSPGSCPRPAEIVLKSPPPRKLVTIVPRTLRRKLGWNACRTTYVGSPSRAMKHFWWYSTQEERGTRVNRRSVPLPGCGRLARPSISLPSDPESSATPRGGQEAGIDGAGGPVTALTRHQTGGGAPAGRQGALRTGGCRLVGGGGHVTRGGRGAPVSPSPAAASLWVGPHPAPPLPAGAAGIGGEGAAGPGTPPARPPAHRRCPPRLAAGPSPTSPSPHGGGARGHRPLSPPAPASPSPLSSSLSARGGVRGGDRR